MEILSLPIGLPSLTAVPEALQLIALDLFNCQCEHYAKSSFALSMRS